MLPPMLVGDLWRHRYTKRVVRIERYRGGFLSISLWTTVWRDGQWTGEFKMSPSLWDEPGFRLKFEPYLYRQ